MKGDANDHCGDKVLVAMVGAGAVEVITRKISPGSDCNKGGGVDHDKRDDIGRDNDDDKSQIDYDHGKVIHDEVGDHDGYGGEGCHEDV